MTAPQKEKAKLEVLENAEVFKQKLGQCTAELQLLIEWTLESLPLCSVSSGTEAVQCFTQWLSKDQHHLYFRAFTTTVEYAWFGTVGVRVELADQGNLEVNEQEYYVREKKRESQTGYKARVQQLIQNGHVVYEKLLPEAQKGEA